jgi:predicted AAA+ superfamily ATPase
MIMNAADYINHGFDTMRSVLAEFICRELCKKDKDAWWNEFVLGKLNEAAAAHLPASGEYGELVKSIDIYACFKIIESNWNEIFKNVLTRGQRTNANEILEFRNTVSHHDGKPLTDDDAFRALDTMVRFIEPIDQTSVEAIRKLMNEVRQKIDGAAKKTLVIKTIEPGPMPQLAYAVPWRQIAEPRPDVAQGNTEIAQFAASLQDVLEGKAAIEYQDPTEFYERTYITEGMRGMLIKAIQRVSGKGGEPVIQLKTSFGGGKTHSMMALYHLMGAANPEKLNGVSGILADAGVASMPKVNAAVLVGFALNPTVAAPSKKLPGVTVHTLWGEIAAQLAEQTNNPAVYDLVKQADAKGISPGSAAIKNMLEQCAPCMILIDELVAYARKIYGAAPGENPSGTFDNILSFIQELTEAARATKNCMIVASIPESEIEAGTQYGIEALRRLEHTFGRMEAVWKPVVAEEGFEIVRRRLFKPITDTEAVEKTCKAFFSEYQNNPTLFPPECKEVDYLEKIKRCYPIHPEVFDRLYNDWATIDHFQRTRGVLRLLAKVVYELYNNNDGGAMITCGTIPVGIPSIRDELTRYLSNGWNPIIDSEIDGSNSKPPKLDDTHGGFYKKQFAYSRISRAIFLGSAPSSVAQRNRGIDASHVYLGVVQPEENINTYEAALGSLADNLAFLYRADNRYWYDTRPTLRKTVADRARNQQEDSVIAAIEEALKNITKGNLFDLMIHRTPAASADIPDDQNFHLVLFRATEIHKTNDAATKGSPATNGSPDSPALSAAREYLEKRGSSPRIHRNMIAFLAPDSSQITQLKRETKMFLAWKSIEKDADILNLDTAQRTETRDAISATEKMINQRIEETWCHLIVPTQEGTEAIQFSALKIPEKINPVTKAVQKMKQDELLVDALSPKFLSMEMSQYNLWQGKNHITVRELWADYTRYVYLHRLKNRSVLEKAIEAGMRSGEFFAWADGQDDAGRYEGLTFLSDSFFQITLDGLVVKADVAKAQIEKENEKKNSGRQSDSQDGTQAVYGGKNLFASDSYPVSNAGINPDVSASSAPKPTHFYGTIKIEPAKMGSTAGQINTEVLQHFSRLPGASINVSLDIQADIPSGVPEDIIRTIRENCRTMKFDSSEFD